MRQIRVFLASRERPARLAAALWSLWTLASEDGRDHVNFAVAADDDDLATHQMCRELSKDLPLVWMHAPRPSSSHALLNVVAQLVEPTDTLVWNDRLVAVTPLWDRTVRRFTSVNPTRVAWWEDKSAVSTGSRQWVMPQDYFEAVDRKVSSEIFPFWFDDLWHFEIDWFISQQMPLEMPAGAAGIHKTTRRGRDFRFWTEVFIQTRPERIQIAERAAGRLNLQWKPVTASMEAHYQRNDAWQLENASRLETMFGDPEDPGPEYREAKRQAEERVERMFSIT